MAFQADANAAPYDYVITPSPTVFGFTGGTTDTLSGVFSFSGSTLLSVNLTLGGDGPGVKGAYTIPYANPISPRVFEAFDSTTGALAIGFNQNLIGLVTPIFGFDVETGCASDVVSSCTAIATANRITAGAAADPIPEPSSIAILGAALGLFGLRRRVARRR
jgi:hypothetical protein